MAVLPLGQTDQEEMSFPLSFLLAARNGAYYINHNRETNKNNNRERIVSVSFVVLLRLSSSANQNELNKHIT